MHYINYRIFRNKNNEIEIRIYDSFLSERKDKKTGSSILSILQDHYESYIKKSRGEVVVSEESKITLNTEVKFSIGRAPQQDGQHFNCGEHSFTNNALKDLFKAEKSLLKYFPIIKYTNKQDETNIVFAFLIEIFIFLRRLLTDAYKSDSQKMFKLIEIIAEISILEQNADAALKELEIENYDIVKDLREDILRLIKNEFDKKKDNYSVDDIRNKLHDLFEKKINEKIQNEHKALDDTKIQNIMTSLGRYDVVNSKISVVDNHQVNSNFQFSQEELLKGRTQEELFSGNRNPLAFKALEINGIHETLYQATYFSPNN